MRPRTRDIWCLVDECKGLAVIKDGDVPKCKKHAESTITRLRAVEKTINTPQTKDFIEAVRNEAAHQLNRWGGEHDDSKAPEDWMWLLGWLISKAVQQPDKRLHHIVTSAAALAQWHRQESEPAKSGNYCHACCGIHEPGRYV